MHIAPLMFQFHFNNTSQETNIRRVRSILQTNAPDKDQVSVLFSLLDQLIADCRYIKGTIAAVFEVNVYLHRNSETYKYRTSDQPGMASM